MTQRRASTPDILVHHSSPSQHRVGNRLPPRGELSPSWETRGRDDRTTQKDRRQEKVTSSFNVKFADVPAMREFPVVVEGESAIPPNEGSGR